MVLEALWGALQLKVSNGMGLGTIHPVLKTPETVGFFFSTILGRTYFGNFGVSLRDGSQQGGP